MTKLIPDLLTQRFHDNVKKLCLGEEDEEIFKAAVQYVYDNGYLFGHHYNNWEDPISTSCLIYRLKNQGLTKKMDSSYNLYYEANEFIKDELTKNGIPFKIVEGVIEADPRAIYDIFIKIQAEEEKRKVDWYDEFRIPPIRLDLANDIVSAYSWVAEKESK